MSRNDIRTAFMTPSTIMMGMTDTPIRMNRITCASTGSLHTKNSPSLSGK
ncbi:MAG: hypothetical protein HY811_06325 [Planctomycetes bacterium]|nr:hypothetical protein [Planctomycetota bacterium]